MPNDTRQIVNKAWSFTHLLRDDGLSGGDEILHLPPLVNRRDHAGAGAGQRARALDHLLKHRGQVEALADAENRRAQPGDAVIGRAGRASIVQCSTPAEG